MKLLDRKKISSDFQIQKKLQVDEGIVIARRIDVLRETLSSLEKQHRDFLAGTQQDLINATKHLEIERDTVKQEVEKLEVRRKELLKPLDDEWATLNEEKTRLGEFEKSLELKETNLNGKEQEVEKTQKEIEKDKEEVLNLKTLAENDRNEASIDREASLFLRKDIQTIKTNLERDYTIQTDRFAKKEEELEHQRAFIQLREDNVKAREAEQDDRERTINDKYQTLLRSIKRNKNAS